MPSLKLENRWTRQQCGVLGVADVPGLSAEGQFLTSYKAGLLEPNDLAGTAMSQEYIHKNMPCL